jgi:hypothetical protein
MKLEDALKSGDACTRCHIGIHRAPYNKVIAPALCHECKQIDQADELDHRKFLRCPKCKETWDAWDEDCDILADGPHDVTCPECEHEFEILTEVSYNFSSPEIDPS